MLSICIPTRDRARYLERCLGELTATAALPFPVEIVVSDNASSDDTLAVCAAFADRLPLRVEVQAQDVGAEANVVSVLRAARGRYAVYLGDDDRLDLARVADVISIFEESPSLVCVQAPWVSRDDAGGRDLGLFYPLSEPALFGRGQAWPCWQFLLKQRIFPEIAIYRTRDLHAILHLPRTVHWAFVWCFRLLGRGNVAFLPVPFYVHVVRPAADLPARTQLGVTQSATHLDRYRGGLEWGLAAALRQVAGHVPEEHRIHAMRLLDRFLAERAEVAARVAASQVDFIAATEHFSRSRVWDAGVELPDLHRFELEHTMLAALQALVQTARSSAGCTRIVLVDVDNAERVQALIAQVFGWTGGIELVSEPVAVDDGVVLVPDTARRVQAEATGTLPGRILVWSELADCYRVHNVLGAIAATSSAA